METSKFGPEDHKDGRSQDLPIHEQPGKSRVRQLYIDHRIGRPTRILVVGGGPAGLIALHELLNPINRPNEASLHDYEIRLYERRPEIGGVWYFEPENAAAKGWKFDDDDLGGVSHSVDGVITDDTASYAAGKSSAAVDQRTTDEDGVDSGYASHDQSPPNGLETLTSDADVPVWPTPAYEGLVGNVLPPLLEFSAKKFPPPADGLFPSMTETHEYLLEFAAPLRRFVHTNTEVIDIRPRVEDLNRPPVWVVKSKLWDPKAGTRGMEITEEWDAVVVCPGAFDNPYWPDIPGLSDLRASRSSLVMHAKTYPSPQPFIGKKNKTVVVGNANSANDIAAHLAPLNTEGPLYRCIRHESNFAYLPDDKIKDVAPISALQSSRDRETLCVDLQDGTRIEDVSKVIFATGYQYRFPWLQVIGLDATLRPVSLHGAVPDLHLATLHSHCPTLAMIGLSVTSNPVPFSECQARLAARTFMGIQPLPKDLGLDFRARREELGLTFDDPAKWRLLHYLRGPPERVLQAAVLSAMESSERGATSGLFRWDEERETVAKNMRGLKEAELQRARDAKEASAHSDRS